MERMLFLSSLCFVGLVQYADTQDDSVLSKSQPQFATLTQFNLVEGGLYSGDYRSSLPGGEGLIVYFTDDKQGRYNYSGSWDSGKRSGKGITYFRNNDMHEGIYADDKADGRGTLKYTNGNVFEGYFVSGQRHGNGKLFYSGGASREGEWKLDKLDGLVIFRDSAGIELKVERWESGRRKVDNVDENVDSKFVGKEVTSEPTIDRNFLHLPSEFSRSPKRKDFSFAMQDQLDDGDESKNISNQIRTSEARSRKIQFDAVN